MGNKNSTKHINDAMNELVSEKLSLSSADKIADKLQLDDKTAYIKADPFIGNPYSLLGRVMEVRKINGQCPSSLNDALASIEFSPLPILGRKIDETSKIKKAIKRDSIIVDKNAAANVGFLKFFESQLSTNSFFSIMVFDSAVGLVDVFDQSWDMGLMNWKKENKELLEDPEVCYLYAIVGMVQKDVIRKKYVKFEAGAKGGAYGLNVNGQLATSTEDYSFDTIFGLTPAIIKRPDQQRSGVRAFRHMPVIDESELFASLSGINLGDEFD